jgi:hypothetical protein
MCLHPQPHKLKDYGFAEEILCPQCRTSLRVESKVDYVREKWFKRFLNKIRSWIASGKLISQERRSDGCEIVIINTFLVRSLAREIGLDEDTLWKYALLLQGQNVDGFVKPTTIPYDGERHLAIQVIPGPRECEVWPCPVADLAIHSVECNHVVGPRGFAVKVWLDYYFEKPTQVFIGVGNTGEWLGQEIISLAGEVRSPLVVRAKTPPALGHHNLSISSFYLEDGKWVEADSEAFSLWVEDIETSGLGALIGALIGGTAGGLVCYAISKKPEAALLGGVVAAPLSAIAGDGLEYDAVRGERERQLFLGLH